MRRYLHMLVMATLLAQATGSLRFAHVAVDHAAAAFNCATCPTTPSCSSDEQPDGSRKSPAHSDHDCPVCHFLSSLASMPAKTISAIALIELAGQIRPAPSRCVAFERISPRQSRAPPVHI